MNPLQAIKTAIQNKMSMPNVINQICPNNPIISNLVSMANKGDTKGIDQIARNLCKEKGIDFDKEFGKFMKNFK